MGVTYIAGMIADVFEMVAEEEVLELFCLRDNGYVGSGMVYLFEESHGWLDEELLTQSGSGILLMCAAYQVLQTLRAEFMPKFISLNHG